MIGILMMILNWLWLRADKPLYFTTDLIQKYIDTDNGPLEITM
jgi:hypothetical protein